jgi:hypothetical protein
MSGSIVDDTENEENHLSDERKAWLAALEAATRATSRPYTTTSSDDDSDHDTKLSSKTRHTRQQPLDNENKTNNGSSSYRSSMATMSDIKRPSTSESNVSGRSGKSSLQAPQLSLVDGNQMIPSNAWLGLAC